MDNFVLSRPGRNSLGLLLRDLGIKRVHISLSGIPGTFEIIDVTNLDNKILEQEGRMVWFPGDSEVTPQVRYRGQHREYFTFLNARYDEGSGQINVLIRIFNAERSRGNAYDRRWDVEVWRRRIMMRLSWRYIFIVKTRDLRRLHPIYDF